MEPATILTIMVFSVGALHLVWQAASGIGKLLGKTQQNLTYGKRSKSHRDDWYVFFHRSDLTGPDTSKEKSKSLSDRQSTSSTRRRKSSRRLVARVNLS